MNESQQALVQKYLLDRYERHIRDLTPQQTEALVKRKLAKDVDGQEIVLGLLRKVFRAEPGGERVALSGKPVIISFILEMLDDLKTRKARELSTSVEEADAEGQELSEWQIYKMIVDRLMMRDVQRSHLKPQIRRGFLQLLAITLSGRDNVFADEAVFNKLINLAFRSEFRFMDSEERNRRRAELFEDLRVSATLTRSESRTGSGWMFSHNSLREFLVTEHLISSVAARQPTNITVPITSAMRSFASSLPLYDLAAALGGLWDCWQLRQERKDMGAYVSLFWDALAKSSEDSNFPAPFGVPASAMIPLDDVRLVGVQFTQLFHQRQSLTINGTDSEFSEVSFSHRSLQGSIFEGAVFDSVLFRKADISRVNFDRTLFYECDFTGTEFKAASFVGLDSDSTVVLYEEGHGITRLSGAALVGYLNYHGAITDEVAPFYFWQNHPKFSIAYKIAERLIGQKNSQLRGLTQRGVAHADPPFARAFLDHLKQYGMVAVSRNELVAATGLGRQALSDFVEHKRLPELLRNFFEERR